MMEAEVVGWYDSMDMSLSKLGELVMDRDTKTPPAAWCGQKK